MLIFRVFTDAGCGGIRYPEVSDYRPQPLGYSYASLSRASHDWRGGGRFYPRDIAALNPWLFISLRFPVLRTIAGAVGGSIPGVSLR